MRRLVQVMAIVLGIAGTLPAATYHVDWDTGDDGNDGSQAKPWKTPWSASGKDEVRPGDTVVVHARRDGSAYANGDRKLVISTRTPKVTWKAAEGETVKLAAGDGWGDTASPQGSKVTVGLGSDDCVLDGFHIWGCVYVRGDRNTVRNCDISGGGNMTGNDNFPCVLYIHGSMDGSNDSEGNLIQNNRIHDNLRSEQYAPRDDNSPLIMTYYEKDTVYENNEICNGIGPGMFNKSAPENIVVRYNYIHHCHVGIRGSEGNQQFGGDQTYYQNVIASCTDAGIRPRAAGEHAYYVYNNTFFDNGAAVFKWCSWRHCHFFNNITYVRSARYAIKLDEGWHPSVFSYLDYNDYYASGGNLTWFINYAKVASSLSQWQRWLAGQGTGEDVRESHSVTTDPGFVNGSGRFDTPEDFKRRRYVQDGRRGDCPKVMGAYVTGKEKIGVQPR